MISSYTLRRLEDEAEALKSKAAAVRFRRQQLDEAVAEEVPKLRRVATSVIFVPSHFVPSTVGRDFGPA